MFKFINNIATLHDQQEGILSGKLKFSENSAPCNSLCTCNTCRRIWWRLAQTPVCARTSRCNARDLCRRCACSPDTQPPNLKHVTSLDCRCHIRNVGIFSEWSKESGYVEHNNVNRQRMILPLMGPTIRTRIVCLTKIKRHWNVNIIYQVQKDYVGLFGVIVLLLFKWHNLFVYLHWHFHKTYAVSICIIWTRARTHSDTCISSTFKTNYYT